MDPVIQHKPTAGELLRDERECACTPSRMWLDVVAVIDTSLGTPKEELRQALASLCEVFGQTTITQGEGHQSRVGVVTYGNTAEERHNLTEFKSFHEFCSRIKNIQQSNETSSILMNALMKAAQIFTKGRVNGFRKNVKEVIIIYVSVYGYSYFEDAWILADQLKRSGKIILIIAFDYGGEPEVLQQLRSIATADFYYIHTEPNLSSKIQHALCAANCFCRKHWVQYTFGNLKYGICLEVVADKTRWNWAKESCSSDGSGHLVTVFSKAKHDFVAYLVTSSPYPYVTSDTYHIGLSYDTAQNSYFWEQPASSDPAIIMASTDFQKWNKGFPSLDGNATCVIATKAPNSYEFGWQNVNCDTRASYVCRMNTCDTDNYCFEE